MGFNENKKLTTSKGAIRTGLARSFIGDLPYFQLDLPRCPYRSRSCKEIEQHPHFLSSLTEIYATYTLKSLGYIAVFGECKSGGPSRVGSLKELESKSWMEIGQLSG